MNYVFLCVAGIISGILASMGLGGGGVLIIYLTLFKNIPQNMAQGINLMFFVPIALVSLILHSKSKLVNMRLAIKFGILGILGAALGCWLAMFISSFYLSKIFGVLLMVMGAMQFKKQD